MILPCIDSEVDLTDDLIAGLQLKNPQIDVRSELLKINLWLFRYPTRRPTSRRFLVFFDNWVKKVKLKPVKIHLVNGQMTESQMLSLGRQKGIEPRAGESWERFAQRLRA